MSIIYSKLDSLGSDGVCGKSIKKCYIKRIFGDNDRRSITKKAHHHTSFEIHMITEGFQEYRVKDKSFKISEGEFLMIPPSVDHVFLSSSEASGKYSLTFFVENFRKKECLFGKVPERIMENIRFISEESMGKKEISPLLIENSLLETVVLFLRLIGFKERNSDREEGDPAALSMSKQFIGDNIERVFTVHDVSQYCYISSKQLTRIFKKYEGMSPGAYIIGRRIEKIEELLSDPTLTLKQISERMNFANEYYFNAFFKKYAGMPPGAYRKMVEK